MCVSAYACAWMIWCMWLQPVSVLMAELAFVKANVHAMNIQRANRELSPAHHHREEIFCRCLSAIHDHRSGHVQEQTVLTDVTELTKQKRDNEHADNES